MNIARRGAFFSRSRLRLLLWGSAGAAVVGGTVLYATQEPVRYGVDFTVLATRRMSIVTTTLMRCMWKYHKVLSASYASESEREAALSECHRTTAEWTRRALEKNSGLYIKIGQHIAALTYLFPEEWTNAMIPLQDRCPVSSYDSIADLFKVDTGRCLDEVFSEFAREPMGTASLAQVHYARLKDGSEVAVKIQHPKLQRFIPLDVMIIESTLQILDYFFPQYPLGWLGDEIQSSIYTELDFRQEAANAMRTAAYFKPFYRLTALRVPEVYWAKKRILCMEFLAGGRPDDLEYLAEHNIDRADVSACFAHLFNNMIFTPNVGLHCDPHPGNIAIRPVPEPKQRFWSKRNFEIVLYDHGLYRYVPTPMREAYAHLWLALLDGDDRDMRKYAKEFAHISDKDFLLFAAAITGRDFDNATQNVMSRRDKSETARMVQAVQQGDVLCSLMQMLRDMPRIVLLILKTNDLVRLLDEKLDYPLGIVRTFLIMARYCAETVFYEGKASLDTTYGSRWSLGRIVRESGIYWRYYLRLIQLFLYDTLERVKGGAGH